MNLSIQAKLLTGFTVITFLLASVGFIMINKLSEANDRLNELVDVSSKRVSLSKDLLVDVLQATRQEKNMIMEKNLEKKAFFQNRMNEANSAVDKKIRSLQGLLNAEGAKDLNEFITAWNKYKITIDEIVGLALKNETARAFELSITKGYNTREEATSIIQRIVERNEAKMLDDKLKSDESYKLSLALIIALILTGVLVSVLISYWIIRAIGKRITFISKEAEKIASREFSGGKLEDNTNDELKVIFNSLSNINESFREITENANAVASGDYTVSLIPRSNKDVLGNALKEMTSSLREKTATNEKHNWLAAGQNLLNEKLRGDQSISQLANNTISFLCSYLKANIGAVYLLDGIENTLILSGQHAYLSPPDAKEKFVLNEGLIGQAAQEQKQISITDITEEQIRITSSILDAKPKHLLITPFMFEGRTLGVIEIGRLSNFSETEKEFINSSMESIAIAINSAIARKRIQELLEETQSQSEELLTQQEELKQMNEELEEQTQNLKQQQEELQMSNEELEEQTQSLEMKNKEVELAKYDIEQKTRQLELSSKYKSEFLANMSHELRTPLNSLLILSKDLSENRPQNLNQDQVESANIIYKSGHDLLNLINEVLDLSKIEAGKMVINIERVSLRSFTDSLLRDFKHSAEQKGLSLNSKFDTELPEYIRTDSQRLNQILKNLLSNAIKFTEKGSVSVSIKRHTENTIIISVADTGIGIPEDKQMAIFEAFQQADGGTSRKYGGTGLGLSISKELAKLLAAEIKLSSKVNEGSVFSVIVPLEIHQPNERVESKPEKQPVLNNSNSQDNSTFLNYPAIEDDRDAITANDKVVLIIEDDLQFASILLNQAHQKGFKCLAAATGEDGLALALKYKPNAIILDMDLPGIKGHNVLLELKANPVVRHIPVHIMSVNERRLDTIKDGAIEYLVKPVNKKDLEDAFNRIENFVNRKMKNLLIIEDDENSRKAIRKLIGNGDVTCLEAETGKKAEDLYQKSHIDCIVLDLGLPDMSGFDLIQKLEKIKGRIPPIIVYTGKELTREENNELQNYADSIIIKGVKSEERLLDETALFLHRAISNLPESKQVIINNLYDKEAIFYSKKILLADDDMRNVFALSKVLKERGMEVIKVENGKIALEMLDKQPAIDLILMDIMMPEMDGYEAMKQIRLQGRFKNLPIIALTAKAMKDDRQKCIDAGANDYIAKPVDVERLLSLMRVWLSR